MEKLDSKQVTAFEMVMWFFCIGTFWKATTPRSCHDMEVIPSATLLSTMS